MTEKTTYYKRQAMCSVLTARQRVRYSEPKTAFCRATTRYLFTRLSHDSSINCRCEITPCHDVILRSNYNAQTVHALN